MIGIPGRDKLHRLEPVQKNEAGRNLLARCEVKDSDAWESPKSYWIYKRHSPRAPAVEGNRASNTAGQRFWDGSFSRRASEPSDAPKTDSMKKHWVESDQTEVDVFWQ